MILLIIFAFCLAADGGRVDMEHTATSIWASDGHASEAPVKHEVAPHAPPTVPVESAAPAALIQADMSSQPPGGLFKNGKHLVKALGRRATTKKMLNRFGHGGPTKRMISTMSPLKLNGKMPFDPLVVHRSKMWGENWPGNGADGRPIKLFSEDGKKVRNRVNNDVGKIVRLKSASGQHSLKFVSDRFGAIYWVQPNAISHDVVGYTYIPPHQGQDKNGRIYQQGDEVIVVDPKNWAFQMKGKVGLWRSLSGDVGSMRVDFPDGSFGWFKPRMLEHADSLQMEAKLATNWLAVTKWPGLDPDGVPITVSENGKKVRNRVNNDVGKIEALTSASGQHALKFVSDRNGRIYWLLPSDISHNVDGYEYIPAHRIYKEGGEVVVVDPGVEWAFKRIGKVGLSAYHKAAGGLMRVEFDSVHYAWFTPSQLKPAT